MISLGVCLENIIILKDYNAINAKNMYFDNEIIKINDIDKMFADIGSFDGNDTIRYLKWCEYAGRGYVFEADAENFKVCEERLKKYNNIKLYNWRLGERREIRSFQLSNTSSSKLSEFGDTEIKLYPLDEVFGFLKMDVEGAEEEVLKRANKIISTQKPIIAISVYHQRERYREIAKTYFRNEC